MALRRERISWFPCWEGWPRCAVRGGSEKIDAKRRGANDPAHAIMLEQDRPYETDTEMQ
jgi:hypothetical protein